MESQPFLDQAIAETRAHLCHQITTLIEAKSPGYVIMNYALMLDLCDKLLDKAQKDRRFEDISSELFKKFGLDQ